MFILKQSTSIAVPFYAHDGNGDAVLGVIDASWTKRISKAGGAWAAMTVTITEMENGWYNLTLSTAHTDTLDLLLLTFKATGVKQANLMFRVVARLEADLAYPATTGRSLLVDAAGRVDVGSWVGVAPNALINGRIDAMQAARNATAQAGAAGTITLDAGASAVDNFFSDTIIQIVSGTGAGQSRLISAYVGATKVASVVPNWATNPDATSVFAILADARVNVALWLGTAPNVLIAGRMDSNVQAMAAAVIAAATFAADTDTYQAKLTLDRDSVGTTDRYVVAFFKNGQPITSGITVPTLTVTTEANVVLITAVTPTQIGTTGVYKYDAVTTERITTGVAYFGKVTATIDGATRTWYQPISRDT